MDDHPLAELLRNAAVGERREPVEPLRVLPAPPRPAMAIVGLPGMHVIASSASEAWVRSRLTGDLMGPLGAGFTTELAAEIGRVDDGLDLVLAAEARGGQAALTELSATDHARTARAVAHRIEVRAFTDSTGAAVVVVGRGLAGRVEVSIEVSPHARDRGVARAALLQARRLIPAGQIMYAQCAPANAASIRALLAAGFAPIGAEVLFFDGARATS